MRGRMSQRANRQGGERARDPQQHAGLWLALRLICRWDFAVQAEDLYRSTNSWLSTDIIQHSPTTFNWLYRLQEACRWCDLPRKSFVEYMETVLIIVFWHSIWHELVIFSLYFFSFSGVSRRQESCRRAYVCINVRFLSVFLSEAEKLFSF